MIDRIKIALKATFAVTTVIAGIGLTAIAAAALEANGRPESAIILAIIAGIAITCFVFMLVYMWAIDSSL